ncbi:protein kinase domain-containing protein [Chitinilyticum litopenaei]|uniref:protein kinase domain-containing protein n=1 Tax=Chitinilyticum litopenaei TaxID=1121276 RepID=UPI000424C884|nr:serine/threonine-protein kinase [Chitinilyticum litopenaei]
MQIGKYQIRQRLGGGATADVYLAWDPFLRTEVAVKVFRADLLSDAETARRVRHMFLNEARLVRELHHPNIVSTLDAVQNETQAYVVMEYIAGQPLSAHCRAGSLLPLERVLQIGFQCCLAMRYAEQHGLVHRDLKPDNLLLGKNGDIKITDFGASDIAGAEHTALTGLVGTPYYMAPEMLAGDAVDSRADMFSLGVVLYELLTGTRPFQADNVMGTLYQISHAVHAPLRSRRPDLPLALEVLLEIALQKDPDARFPSWQAFADHLSAIDQTVSPPKQELSDREKFLALRRNPFFSEFTDPEIWQVLRLATWHRIDAGRALMKEGRPGSSFSVLLDGEAAVYSGQTELARLQPGECMGEMAYITPEKPLRRATVVTTQPSLVVKIRRRSVETAPPALQYRFEHRFLRMLVNRLEETSAQLVAG